jgi:MarR family transcriptional regulator, organic hydroperoxide resistance regulator
MTPFPYRELGRLFVNVCRLHHTRANQSMEQAGLFRGQAYLLLILSQDDGMTHSEIAEKLEISPAAATKVIQRMEQEHYLQRRPDPTDERISRVFLRDEGRGLIGKIHRAFEQLDLMMFEGVPEPDLERFRDLLTHMQANLQRVQPKSPISTIQGADVD